jgi:hypothetical protein
MTAQYAELAKMATASAAIMGSGPDNWFLAHLQDGSVVSADATAAGLLGYRLLGLVALIDGVVVARGELEDAFTLICATEFFMQRLESLPAGARALLDLERLAKLEDTRPEADPR